MINRGGVILIDEALEVFRKIYDKEGEELVVSKHIPKDGTYILVNIKPLI